MPRYALPCRASGRTVSRWVLALALSLAGRAAGTEPVSFNPVAGLRQALLVPVVDAAPISPELDARRRLLYERIGPLCRAPDLREALLLVEWRDEDTDEAIAAVDRAVRAELGRRFELVVRAVFRQGDSPACTAAANMLADVAGALRAASLQAGTLRGLGNPLAELTRHPDTQVREAAAVALGRVHPDSAVAVPALDTLFVSDDPVLRRAAARGLLSLVEVATRPAVRSNGRVADPPRLDVIRVGRAVVPIACSGLGDPEAEVRLLSIETLRQMAMAIGKLVREPRTTCDVGREGDELWALAGELKEKTSGLTTALNDPAPAVRQLARHALEDMGAAWMPWRTRETVGQPGQVMTARGGADGEGGTVFALARDGGAARARQPLLDRLNASLPALTTGLKDGDVRSRLAALDALETLGGEAAGPALVGVLADRDRFVRWAAARSLGKLGPPAPPGAITGLAGLLGDADVDVRRAALEALRRYGPEAREAVPAVARLVSQGDTEVRLAAIRTLEGIGSADFPCIPTLATALLASDVRVQAAAARLLGRFGPDALEAADALRGAMVDPEGSVRQAASDALLAILPPPVSLPPLAVPPAPGVQTVSWPPSTPVRTPAVTLLAPVPIR